MLVYNIERKVTFIRKIFFEKSLLFVLQPFKIARGAEF